MAKYLNKEERKKVVEYCRRGRKEKMLMIPILYGYDPEGEIPKSDDPISKKITRLLFKKFKEEFPGLMEKLITPNKQAREAAKKLGITIGNTDG